MLSFLLLIPESAGHLIFDQFSGDDKEANIIVSEIISKIGFAPIDLGSLAAGGKLQQFNWPLNGQNFIKL